MEKLKCGDILVFKAGDSWLSKTIAWLTDSDVSHAAMMLDDKRMVEMSVSGINVGNVEALEGEDAILLRLHPEKDPSPLADAAQKYIDSKTRYDFPALVYLAGLIIYHRIRPTQKYVAITDLILRGACAALDRLIQSVVLKNPDKAMVASQLVYQIYEDCGKEYHINIEGGLLQADKDSGQSGGSICLADLIASTPDLSLAASDVLDEAVFGNVENPDVEELARELYLALSEQEAEAGMDFAQTDLGALPTWAKRMMEKLEEFLEKSQSNLPINALFVSPADLAYRATNLDTVARLDIARLMRGDGMDKAYFTKRISNDTDLTLFERDSVTPGVVYDVFDGEFGVEEGSSEAYYRIYISLKNPSDILLEGSVTDSSGHELCSLPSSTVQMTFQHSFEGSLNVSGEIFLRVRARYVTDTGAVQSPELILPLIHILPKGSHKLEHPTKRKEGEPVRRYGDYQTQVNRDYSLSRDTRYVVTVLNRNLWDTDDIDYICCWGSDGYYPYFGLPGKGSIIGPKNSRFLPDSDKLRASCVLYPKDALSGGGILTASANSVALEYDCSRLIKLCGSDGKQYEINVGDIIFNSTHSAPHIAQYEFLGAWKGKHLVYDEPESWGKIFDYELKLHLPFQIPNRPSPVVYDIIVTSRKILSLVALVDHSVLPVKIMYGCFARGSVVQTPDGGKRIEDIRIGDVVCTPDGKSVVRNCCSGPEEWLVRISTCTGHSILVTQDHPMQTNRGLVRASKLDPSIHQLMMSEAPAAISDISLQEYRDTVYNIELDGGCLIVNGFITGDFSAQNGRL